MQSLHKEHMLYGQVKVWLLHKGNYNSDNTKNLEQEVEKRYNAFWRVRKRRNYCIFWSFNKTARCLFHLPYANRRSSFL